MDEEHKCEGLKNMERNRVDEIGDFPIYGHAIFAIHKVGDKWICHNYEYGNYIYFCPFCGKKL